MRHDIRRLCGLVAVALAIATPVAAEPVRFLLRPERSKIEFVSGTQLGDFRGGTAQVTGEVLFDPTSPARLQASVAVDPRTLKSDNGIRDRHMQDTLLETARFPTIRLIAREFRPNGNRDGLLVGSLLLHGVERPVTVPVRYAIDHGTLEASARFSVRLADFGMTPPQMLGVKVRDEVVVETRLVGTDR